jgi:hypothetical protein
MTEVQFKVGDIVTRDGTDRQNVIAVGEYNDITVECIKEPKTGWIKKGETETNLARRYALVESEGELKKRIKAEIIATSTRMDGLRCDLAGRTMQPYQPVTMYQKYFDFEKNEPFTTILDEAKKDFPYKIFKDNNGFGENPEPVFSFYIKNPVDPDKSFPIEDLLEVESKIAIWHKKWFGKTNL